MVLREKAARRQLSPKLFKAGDPKTVGKGRGQVEVQLNAGITDDTLLMRMTEDQFTKVVDANLTGAFRVAKRANRAMLRARQRVLQLSRAELMEITEDWVDAAFTIEEKDLAFMERLVMLQTRRTSNLRQTASAANFG